MKNAYIRVEVEVILPISDDEWQDRLDNEEVMTAEGIVQDWIDADNGRTFLDAAQLACVKKVIGWTELSEEEKETFK